MASRAIHTELFNTLSSEGFLIAYQKFTAIRGNPRKIWSDPGTNFIGARPFLVELPSKFGKVVSTNPDHKGAVRDVDVWTFPSYTVPLTRVSKGKSRHSNNNNKDNKERNQATIVHRDVSWLVVLLPVEEQKANRDGNPE
jgi:hypothetical protein